MVAARAVRLTPLGVMVLALLGEGDMHPYEILRRPRKTWTEEWEAADTAGMVAASKAVEKLVAGARRPSERIKAE